MIKEFQFYHGVVFAMLFHYSEKTFEVRQHPSTDNASYVIDNKVAVYIKYSTKRMSPWHFSFEVRHNTEIKGLCSRYQDTIILLVCRDDGVAGITVDEYNAIVDHDERTTKWISVVRRPREKYSVKGPCDTLPYKIGMTDFCEKILH